MPKTHNVHDDIDLMEIFSKAAADGHTLTVVRDEVFEDMLSKLQDVHPRIHMFKWRLKSEFGPKERVVYTKELGFHHTAADKWRVFLPKSFMQAMVDDVGITEVERVFPGVAQYVQNLPNKEQFDSRVERNSTGNHYRNKQLRIPVQPGQPVRG